MKNAPRQTAPKANSTSSVFANSSLCEPNVDEVILSVAMVLQLHMVQDSYADPSKNEAFTVFNDNYVTQNSQGGKIVAPSLEYIYKFLKAMFECAQFTAECNILALIFINRFVGASGMPLNTRNWRPVVLTALLIAQKVWDDKSLVNAQFTLICPMFTVAKLNQLEQRFLEYIDYDVSVSSHLYAKYYFELRTLCEEQSQRDFRLQPMNANKARHLENRSIQFSQNAANEKKKAQEKKRQTYVL